AFAAHRPSDRGRRQIRRCRSQQTPARAGRPEADVPACLDARVRARWRQGPLSVECTAGPGIARRARPSGLNGACLSRHRYRYWLHSSGGGFGGEKVTGTCTLLGAGLPRTVAGRNFQPCTAVTARSSSALVPLPLETSILTG